MMDRTNATFERQDIKRIEDEAKEEADKKPRHISLAISAMRATTWPEATVSVLNLPNV